MVALKVTDCPKAVTGALDPILALEPEWLTSWLTAFDVEVSKPISPEYTAVMLWVARLSDDVERVATPATSGAVTMGVAPSKNETVPVAPGVTVAVNVTDWPNTLGLDPEVRVVVLGSAIADDASIRHKKENQNARRVATGTCLRGTVLH
jgi:hypothetical protein